MNSLAITSGSSVSKDLLLTADGIYEFYFYFIFILFTVTDIG